MIVCSCSGLDVIFSGNFAFTQIEWSEETGNEKPLSTPCFYAMYVHAVSKFKRSLVLGH